MTITLNGSDNFSTTGIVNAGEVNSLAFLMYNVSTTADVHPGDTVAGSNLYPAAVSAYGAWWATNNGVNQEQGSETGGNYLSTSTMSGTWRCLGHGTAAALFSLAGYPMTVWVRTA